jgi:hypothetical protein
MPNGVVTHLEARTLRAMVNREIHPIRCAESCKRKFQKGSRIGDLCAETGHFWWAMKVWKLTERLIANKDWDDWRYVSFDNDRVRLRDVISETECELLAKRRSDLWRALGCPEQAWWTAEWDRVAGDTFGSYYTDLWLDKFDYDPVSWTEEYESAMRENKEDLETEALFKEGQEEYQPLCAQDFFEYWGDDPQKNQNV